MADRYRKVFVHNQNVEQLSEHVVMRPHLEGSIHEELLAICISRQKIVLVKVHEST